MGNTRRFDLKVEQYLLGELGFDEKEAFEKRLKSEPALAAEIERLKSENSAYYAKYPSLKAASAQRRSWWPQLVGALAFATAAAVVIFYWPHQKQGTDEKVKENLIAMNGTKENGITLKGNKPALFLTAGRELKEGDAVKGGDEIQIAYRASGYTHGIIFSVDAEGSTALHFPASFGAPQNLTVGAPVRLATAFKLDDKPGFEKFYFIAAKKPLAVREIVAAASSGSLPKLADVEISQIKLTKP